MIPPSTHSSITEFRVPSERANFDDHDDANRAALQGVFHALIEQPVEPPTAGVPDVVSTNEQLPTGSDLALEQFITIDSSDPAPSDSFSGEATLEEIPASWDLATAMEDLPAEEPLNTASEESTAPPSQHAGDQSAEITTVAQDQTVTPNATPHANLGGNDTPRLNDRKSSELTPDEPSQSLDEALASADDSESSDSSSDHPEEDFLDLSDNAAGQDSSQTTSMAASDPEPNSSFVTMTELHRTNGDSPTGPSITSSVDSTRGTTNANNDAESIKSGVTGYSVELESESAGKVMIRVQDSADGIRARLIAASDTGYRLLEQEIQNVRQVVEQSGIGLADFSLGRHDGQAAQGDSPSRQPTTTNAQTHELATENSTHTNKSVKSASPAGLDVWV